MESAHAKAFEDIASGISCKCCVEVYIFYIATIARVKYRPFLALVDHQPRIGLVHLMPILGCSCPAILEAGATGWRIGRHLLGTGEDLTYEIGLIHRAS
jgi:hypothetical protein